jgi:hypothetical protein
MRSPVLSSILPRYARRFFRCGMRRRWRSHPHASTCPRCETSTPSPMTGGRRVARSNIAPSRSELLAYQPKPWRSFVFRRCISTVFPLPRAGRSSSSSATAAPHWSTIHPGLRCRFRGRRPLCLRLRRPERPGPRHRVPAAPEADIPPVPRTRLCSAVRRLHHVFQPPRCHCKVPACGPLLQQFLVRVAAAVTC